MTKKQDIWGLVCTGGGAHGAYQVGVLKFIHEHFCLGEFSPFQIFTGCSCGSLNTSFFAAQSSDARKSSLWLEELWLDFHIPSYHGNIFKNTAKLFWRQWRKPREERHPTWSLLDPAPMIEVIQKGFIRQNLLRSFDAGTTLGIGVVATELLSGRCTWFIEGPQANPWNLFHSLGSPEKISTPHIAASCSVPIFMPPVRVGKRFFLDGSVALSRPLSAAITMGATKVLSISTEKPIPDDLPNYSAHFRPRTSNVIRMLLNRLSRNAAVDEAKEIAVFNQFYEALSKKTLRLGLGQDPLPLFHDEALPHHYRPAQILQIHPSRRIQPLPAEKRTKSGNQKGRSTRFMFHEKFIRELVDLGYADAGAQREELKDFFRETPVKPGWRGMFRRS